ncbi:Isoflavone 7-O-methyltransferase [Stylosanthes scabra]|uniref:Isoflavone 7-O-methyltransferase n=1 Tax=Stylosanthes scabra TaxID=79078 RepID=A0ABU6UKK6_9FABA|nr:Isoflavone 7-O-methyltransferase [Stylosanthes scabra]
MASSILGPKDIEMFEGQALLYNHCFAYIDSMCLKWCVELNIADIIHSHGQPITLHNLVSTLQVPSSKVGGVQRFMRYLAHNGFFEIVKMDDEMNEAYALNSVSKLLVSSNEYCLSPMIKAATDPAMAAPLNQLKEWIHEEDLSLFGTAKGMEFWEFLNKNPKYQNLFNEAMACDSKMINLALTSCGFVFEGLESIVDVGGGVGTTAKIISEAFPKLKCIVFDLPQVVENLSPTNNNLSFVGGDMFKSIPKAHAMLLKNVLHDWDEENCVKILRNCKEAIYRNGKKGKVIIIESVINEKRDKREITDMKLKYDIYMTVNNGAQKTEEELKRMFIEAGFQGYKLFPIAGIVSLVEVYP